MIIHFKLINYKNCLNQIMFYSFFILNTYFHFKNSSNFYKDYVHKINLKKLFLILFFFFF